MIFPFSSALKLTSLCEVGAALWAADLEKSNTNMTKTTAPSLREAVKKVE
jgi:hypothetical protein